jgi:hypothetical protein
MSGGKTSCGYVGDIPSKREIAARFGEARVVIANFGG